VIELFVYGRLNQLNKIQTSVITAFERDHIVTRTNIKN